MGLFPILYLIVANSLMTEKYDNYIWLQNWVKVIWGLSWIPNGLTEKIICLQKIEDLENGILEWNYSQNKLFILQNKYYYSNRKIMIENIIWNLRAVESRVIKNSDKTQ